ncbi:MAG: hypothetical protein K2I64_02335 [Muribaculaceae bacterium]|nr:hypothetical protein [Muribaculaceae bacterium]
MNKKLLLSLLLGSAAIAASAESVSWVGLGTSCLRCNLCSKGEYSQLNRIVIKMHPDSIDCYITDPTAFEAKLNDKPITPISVNQDENGYAKEFVFFLGELAEGTNKFTYKRRVPYINKKDETGTIRYTQTSTGLNSITIYPAKYTTIESADAIRDDGFSSHEEVITYPFGNPPGEYDYLLGDYAIDLSSRYNVFYRDIEDLIKPCVIDAEGNIIQYCTNKLPRTSDYRDPNVQFHINISKAITTPGEYWLVFPSEGDFRFLMLSGASNNLHHFSNFKIGPYIVREKSEEVAPVAPEVEWISPSTFTCDHLPDTIFMNISNAAHIGKYTSAQTGSYETTLTHDGVSVNVSSILTISDNGVAFALPKNWYNGVGEYTISVNAPANIFEGFAAGGKQIAFSNDEPISTTFTVADPELPEALDFYVRSAGASTYEIADDETVNVRLMHGDQALGLKIFVKWTPEASSSHIAAKAAEGFSEHDGDMEISSPGQLEYYTTRGNVTSPVKTISFTRADDTNTGIDTPEILNIPLEEGLYNLSGIRVSRTPTPGLYIRRNIDGTTRKVIVR